MTRLTSLKKKKKTGLKELSLDYMENIPIKQGITQFSKI